MQTKSQREQSQSGTSSRDHSVVVALSELFELENDRIAQEAAERSRLERLEAEAAAVAEAERLRAQEERDRAERAEMARLRMEAELAERSKADEREAHLSSMRDQLRKVRAEREALRLRVAEMAGRRAPAPRARWPWVISGLGAVAAAFALWVSWPAPTAAPVTLTPTTLAAPLHVEGPAEEEAAQVGGEATEEVADSSASETVASADTGEGRAHGRGGRVHGRGGRGHGRGGRVRDADDQLGLGDLGGDDLLGPDILNGDR